LPSGNQGLAGDQMNRVGRGSCSFVMTGLGPVIHVFLD
jgi:hypothetical protein